MSHFSRIKNPGLLFPHVATVLRRGVNTQCKSKYYTCTPCITQCNTLCSVSCLYNILYIVILNVLLIISLIVAKFIYIRLKKSLY